MEELYHLFRVRSYKGGQSEQEINLTRKELFDYIIEWFVEDPEEEYKSINDISFSERSVCAGGGEAVFSIYKIQDNKLVCITDVEDGDYSFMYRYFPDFLEHYNNGEI